MIEIDWNNDERSTDVSKYLVDPDSDNESRRKAFLGGWNRFLNNESSGNLDGVRWVAWVCGAPASWETSPRTTGRASTESC